jgi:hypothetical protein
MKHLLKQISLLLLILFIYSHDIKAQSNTNAPKAETENWILGKLSKYTPNEYTVYVGYDPKWENYPVSKMAYAKSQMKYRNYFYSFDSYNLIVQYEIVFTTTSISKYKVVIPIYDIQNTSYYNGKLNISTNKNVVIEYNITDNTQHASSWFSTEFDSYSEPDICERMNKALIHLKKFYKKPISKELF